jgi:hypothetical protein
MRKITKSKHFLLLTFSLLMLIAGCAYFNAIPQNEIISTYECCDFSAHCERSYSHGLEDDVLNRGTAVKPYKSEIQKGLLLFTNPSFKDRFNSQIWEPPKSS